MGFQAIDHNAAENAVRPLVLGRKNWLFVGSQQAGERPAVIMSLIESAKLNGHDSWAYLKDVFERLPTLKQRDLEQLLPRNWRPANADSAHEATPIGAATQISQPWPSLTAQHGSRNAYSKSADDGLPLHSFRTLLQDLGTLAYNITHTHLNPEAKIVLTTRPTPLQAKALKLLDLNPACTQ